MGGDNSSGKQKSVGLDLYKDWGLGYSSAGDVVASGLQFAIEDVTGVGGGFKEFRSWVWCFGCQIMGSGFRGVVSGISHSQTLTCHSINPT